ncbi:hypothetical protein E0H80_03990 [Acinetobacter sp. ANC 4779]|uniref:hypothetical protein n=1 Tax=Acinetobacter sp. ANC 4779 TaxID=2529848 RepID=UPI00103D2959|nr:hypothetical protein [Acinetobacter sp. ANC 4779]TCB51924.1 hypothetical protein E0H80_03990 [Acinetobacter sp. ANC 4779]
MKKMKAVLITSAILASTPLFAQTTTETATPTQRQAASYGDNPNIFRVLTQKAQTTVQNTAEKVDHAAQKGIAKVKPKVENAWEGTKDFASEKSVIAIEKTQNAAVKVNNKLNETKDGLIGSPENQSAPIVSHPLSQSSTGVDSVPVQPVPSNRTQPVQNNTRTNL